uniref:hypothetical protein n=1 Tax=Neorhizobium sp. EC2-8 TaxID=3129230 RepID=UPI0031012277
MFKLGSDYDVIFAQPKRPSISLKKGDELSVKATFQDGDVIVARSREDTLADSLEKDGTVTVRRFDGTDQTIAYSTLPLPLLDMPQATLEPNYSPFGRFAVNVEDWLDYLGPTTSTLEHFLYYLAEAFRRPEDGGTDPAWLNEIKQHGPDDGLNSPKAKFLRSYLTWSARFFRAAPLPSSVMKRSTVDPTEWMAVAQPKAVEPHRIATDARGALTFVRFLDEEPGLRALVCCHGCRTL